MAKKVGRPSKYDPKYCKGMVKFFDREPVEVIEVVKENKAGEPYTLIQERPCQCPTFEKYCADTGISKQTFHQWVKKYPEFNDAYQISKNMQANIMMVNGMSGAFNAAFTNLSMKNMHGWSDKQEIENTHTINQMPPVKLNGDPLAFDIGEDVKEITEGSEKE